MKKLLFVISSMSANGAERVMSLLVNQAVKDGNEVFLALVSSPKVEYEIDKNVHIEYVGADNCSSLYATFKRVSNLRKLIKRFDPDVIVSFLTTCNIYCCVAGLGLSSPVIVSERNDPVKDCPSKCRRIVRDITYKFADGYIFQTEEARDYFSKSIRLNSVVIPNPVKKNLPLWNADNDSHVIIAAGRLSKQKNYTMMLDAFSIFCNKDDSYCLHIYGEGPEREFLESYRDKLGLNKKVSFKGLELKIHEKMRDATMYILSSDYEGISNSLLEAMSMGMPCVSTDCPCGGSRHLIENKVSGILTEVGNATDFAKVMFEIASSKEYAKSLGEKASLTKYSHSENEILLQYFKYIDSKGKKR